MIQVIINCVACFASGDMLYLFMVYPTTADLSLKDGLIILSVT